MDADDAMRQTAHAATATSVSYVVPETGIQMAWAVPAEVRSLNSPRWAETPVLPERAIYASTKASRRAITPAFEASFDNAERLVARAGDTGVRTSTS
jgi:hypothetical protein